MLVDCAVWRSDQVEFARSESVLQWTSEREDVCRVGGETLTGLAGPRCDLSDCQEAMNFGVFCGLCIVKRVD